MRFEIVPAAELSLAEQAHITNAAFVGYVAGWTELNAETLARFLSLQGADLCYSRFVRASDGIVGFAYINRTGDVPRLAAMAMKPEARGTGAAAHLLRHIFEEAMARGDQAMVLEVIEQNPRAHAFYLRHGFENQERLSCWRRPAALGIGDFGGATEMSLMEALTLSVAVDYPTLPWQISRYAVAKLQNAQIFQSGDARVVISRLDSGGMRVHSFLSCSMDWENLRRALQGAIQCFPDCEFFAPPLFPQDFGREIFQPLGFVREQLSQFLMRRDL